MENQKIITIGLEKDDQKIITRNFNRIKSGLNGFFCIRRNSKNRLLADIKFYYGKSEKALNGAILIEIKRPSGIRLLNNSYDMLETYNLIWCLFGQAKSELVKYNCQYYEDCLDIAGDCSEIDYSFLKRTKGGWWGFSCQDCSFNRCS